MTSALSAATTKKTIASLPPLPGFPRSILVCTARSFSLGSECAANEGTAEWMRRLHPLRLQYELFSHANPFMRPILSNLEWVRENRKPVSKNNPFWQAQEWFGDWIETSLDAYRDVRDKTSEALFHAIYGSPLVQALVGLNASDDALSPKAGKGCRASSVGCRNGFKN